MFESIDVLVASIRALVNEHERVKALGKGDEDTRRYLDDVGRGLVELIEFYLDQCEANPSLTPWRELTGSFRDNLWPSAVGMPFNR
jgi:hypothetical protein